MSNLETQSYDTTTCTERFNTFTHLIGCISRKCRIKPAFLFGDQYSFTEYLLHGYSPRTYILMTSFLISYWFMDLCNGLQYISLCFSVLGMHAAGIFTFLKRRHFRYLEERACDAFVHATSEAIGIEKTWPLFASTGGLLVLAFGALFLERMYTTQFSTLGWEEGRVPFKRWCWHLHWTLIVAFP